jgi:hypothetical protein
MLAMWLGAYLLLRPVVIIGDVVPVFGSILSAGAGLITLAFAIVSGAVVIAIAWLWYRPLVQRACWPSGCLSAFCCIAWRQAAARHANLPLRPETTLPAALILPRAGPYMIGATVF